MCLPCILTFINCFADVRTELSTKIDKIGDRLGDHEDRIVILEKNQTFHP